jgi:HK97 family phage portal protein
MKFTDRVSAAFKAWRLGGTQHAGFDDAFSAAFRSMEPNRKPANELVALSTAVYSAIDLRSTTISSVPIKLIRNTAEGHEEVTQHPALDLLRYVNPFWTFQRLMQSIEMSMCVYGQAFLVLERDSRGIPQEIWFARADLMEVVTHATEYIRGFRYSPAAGQQLNLDKADVVWIRGVMDPKNEFRCLSPLEAARVSIESGLDAMVSNQAIFKNGLNPGGIVSPKDSGITLTRDQRQLIEEQLNLRMRGADKAHKLAVFSHPMDIQTPALSPADAQFIELMQWTTLDIARVFKVPPTKLMDFSQATYSNVEQADKALYTDCIIPESRRIAAEFTEQLLSVYGDDLELSFDFSRVPSLQEDQSEIVAQMQALIMMGVPLNKVLSEYKPELLPAEGEYAWGNEPMMGYIPPATEDVQAGFGIPKKKDYVAKVPDYGSEAHKLAIRTRDRLIMPYESAFRRAWSQAQAQIVKELTAKLQEPAGTKGLLSDLFGGLNSDSEAINVFVNAFKDNKIPQMAKDIVKAGANRALKALRLGISFDEEAPNAMAFLNDREQRFAEMIPEDQWSELKGQLVRAMAAGAGTDELIRVVQQSPVVAPARAEMVARTEVIGAYNGGLQEGWDQSGLEGQKVWLAALDQRTRESHREAHGQMVDLSDNFEVGGVPTMGPGQSGVAAEDINCRCSVDFIPG